MKLWKTYIVLGVLMALFSGEGHAQVTADFEADTLSFCPPYAVKFTDLSTGRITSRKWYFGQGGTSNTNNTFPSATYTNSGYYDVKLVVSDGVMSDSITKTNYIQAFNLPQANFTTVETPAGCTDLPLNFRDNTVLGDAPLSSYDWNFGDGYKSTQNNPGHTYTAGGKYTVSYTVIDTNGCASTEKKATYVDAWPKPTAAFGSTNLPSACKAPHSVGFKDQSAGTPTLTYAWDLGNGSTSTNQNPGATYASGSYDVTLVVTDGNGCTDTLTKPRFVTVGAARADFEAVNDTFCLSDTTAFKFNNLSVGGSSYLWDFGDGTVSAFQHPTHNYTQEGTYQVTLTIGAGTNCTDKITKTIHVIQPKASFVSDIDYWCDDTTITLTPSTDYPNQAKYSHWGPMGIGYDKTPRSNFSPTSIRKLEEGQHIDSLKIFYPQWGSCSVEVIDKSIRIWRPKGMPTVTPPDGCVPLTVDFKEALSPTDSLKVGTWEFDYTTTHNGRNTTRTYTQAGEYLAFYRVEHVKGCLYEYGPFEIKAGTRQTADFSIDTNVICAGTDAPLNNLSSDTSKIEKYLWTLDPVKNEKSNDFEPKHSFHDTGYKDVTLIVDYNGCRDTMIKKNFVKILGPVGDFVDSLDCSRPYWRHYRESNWIDVHRFKYEFGDYFGVDSVNQSSQYTYSSRGDFKVKLTLYNDTNGCEYEKVKTVRVRDLNLVTSVDTNKACFPYAFSFESGQSQDLSGISMTAYDTTVTPQGYRFWRLNSDTNGAETVRLIGFDVNMCYDTAYHWIKTYKPEAKLDFTDTMGCAPFAVQFNDSTTFDTSLVSWTWYVSGLGYNANQHWNTTFNTPGLRQFFLEVEDEMGCKDTDAGQLNVYSPTPYLSVDNTVCKGDSVKFESLMHTSSDTSYWFFGNGLSATGHEAGTVYNSAGKKTVSLQLIDEHGCDSTQTKSLFIDVQEVNKPSVLTQPNDTNCYPAEIDFTITNPHSSVKYRYWRFDSSEAFIRQSGPASSYTYTVPGHYGVDIAIETTYGCTDTFRFDSVLRVGGPYARPSVEDTLCFETGADVFIRGTTGIKEFRMDFGNGVIDTFPGNTQRIQYKYVNPGFYPLYMLYVDSLEDCIKSWADSIYIQKIDADFTLADSAGCIPFHLDATGKKVDVDEYRWYLDGQLLEKGRRFQRDLYREGQVEVVYQPINTVTGCTAFDTLRLDLHPKPGLFKGGDGTVCEGDSVMAFVSGATSYRWTPNKYLSSDTTGEVMLSPKEDITYEVWGKNQFGCETNIELEFTLVTPPELEPINDTTLYVDQTMTTNIPDNPNYVYSWEPAYYLSCSDCPNPEFRANEDIVYTLTVSDRAGCFSKNTSFKVFVEDEYVLLIPNAFTPNGDGLNDAFDFISKGFESMEHFGIYNRWGEEVYKFKDENDRWDGTFHGEPFSNTVVMAYRGEFIRYSGERVEVTGMVVLMK